MGIPETLSHALSAGNIVALPLALAGGVIAGVNPCCLALYPAAAGACCGTTRQQTLKRPLGNAIAFVLGVAVSVALLGSLAAYIGRMAVVATPFLYVIAVVPILMGGLSTGVDSAAEGDAQNLPARIRRSVWNWPAALAHHRPLRYARPRFRSLIYSLQTELCVWRSIAVLVWYR